MPSEAGHKLAFGQGDLLELKGDVVLLGEDVDGPAWLREKVQVELQGHGSSGTISFQRFSSEAKQIFRRKSVAKKVQTLA